MAIFLAVGITAETGVVRPGGKLRRIMQPELALTAIAGEQIGPVSIAAAFTGGVDVSFSASGLPEGLSLSTDGFLSGIAPEAPGETLATLQAVDRDANVADVALRLIVQARRPSLSTVSIDGTGVIGEPLVASIAAEGSEPIALRFQWRRDGADIEGAGDASWTPAAEDDGAAIAVFAEAENVAGLAAGESASIVVTRRSPVATGAPADVDMTEGDGVETRDAAAFFVDAEGGSWLIDVDGAVQPDIAVIDEAGVVTIFDATTFAGAVVTVRYVNSGGSASASFLATVRRAVVEPKLGVADWSLSAATGADRQLLVEISAAPDSVEPITGYEYRLNSGDTRALEGGALLGERTIDVAAGDLSEGGPVSISLRPVTAAGAGLWSDVKTAAPGVGVNLLSGAPLSGIGDDKIVGDPAAGRLTVLSGHASAQWPVSVTAGGRYRFRVILRRSTLPTGSHEIAAAVARLPQLWGQWERTETDLNVYRNMRATNAEGDVSLEWDFVASQAQIHAGVALFNGAAGAYVEYAGAALVAVPKVVAPQKSDATSEQSSGGVAKSEPAVYATRDPQQQPFASDSVWYIPISSDAKIQPIGALWQHGADVLGDGVQGGLLSDTLEDRKRKAPLASGPNQYYQPVGAPEPVDRYNVDEEPFVPWRPAGDSLLGESNVGGGFALYRAGRRISGVVGQTQGDWRVANNDYVLGKGTTLFGDYDEDFAQDASDKWELVSLNRCAVGTTYVATAATFNSSGVWFGRMDANGKPTDNVHIGVNAVLFQGQPMERRNSRTDYKKADFPWIDAAGREYAVVGTTVPGETGGFVSLYAGRSKSYIAETTGLSLDAAAVRDESRFGSHGGSNTSAAVGITPEMIEKIYEEDDYDAIYHVLKTGLATHMSYNPARAGGAIANAARGFSYTHEQRRAAGVTSADLAEKNGGALKAFIWPGGRDDDGWNDPADTGYYSGGNPYLQRGARLCLPKTIKGKPLAMIYDPAQALKAREVSTASGVTWFFETKLGCAFARAAQKYGVMIDDGNSRPNGGPTVFDPETETSSKAPGKMWIWRFATKFVPGSFQIANNGGTGSRGSAKDVASHYLGLVDGVVRKQKNGAEVNPAFPRVVWQGTEQSNPWSRDNDWISGHFCVVVGTDYNNPGGGASGVSEAPELPAISYLGGTFQVDGRMASEAEKSGLTVWRATNASGDGDWLQIKRDVFNNALSNRALPADAAAGKVVFGDLDEGNYQFRTTKDAGGAVTSGVYTVSWASARTDLVVNMV